MQQTVYDLITEIEQVGGKWDDEICIKVDGYNYLFGIDSSSNYTEILNNKIYFDIVDIDAEKDPAIIDRVISLKKFFENLQFSKHISNDQIKSLLVYFCAVELNDDDSIDVKGWNNIEKRGNKIIITVSRDLLTI